MKEGRSILKSLSSANWNVAVRTYGNDHATLIGLLVQWWIDLLPQNHRALEGGPSHDNDEEGKRGGQCDAVLCTMEKPVGIVEVEGTRLDWTVRKIGKFFESDDFESLSFAILLLYAYEPVGRGKFRRFPRLADNKEILQLISKVSADFSEKSVILITLDKEYERVSKGIRARNDYYCGNPSSIKGFLYSGGKVVDEILLYTAEFKKNT